MGPASTADWQDMHPTMNAFSSTCSMGLQQILPATPTTCSICHRQNKHLATYTPGIIWQHIPTTTLATMWHNKANQKNTMYVMAGIKDYQSTHPQGRGKNHNWECKYLR